MIAYIPSFNPDQVQIFVKGEYVGDLVIFRRGAYLFNTLRQYKRFPGQEAARAWIARRVERIARENERTEKAA